MKNLNKALSVLSLTLALGISSQAYAGSAGAIVADASLSCIGAGSALAIGGALAAKRMPGANAADAAFVGGVLGCGIGLVIGGTSAALASDAPSDSEISKDDIAESN